MIFLDTDPLTQPISLGQVPATTQNGEIFVLLVVVVFVVGGWLAFRNKK